ncbi:unnamed protein product [Sphagnum balticum]
MTGVKVVPDSLTGPPTAIGMMTGDMANLTEMYCIQRCSEQMYCTGVFYDYNMVNPGFVTCFLLAPPGAALLLDEAACLHVRYGVRERAVSVVHVPRESGHGGKTPTSDSCSNFCYMSADCAFAIYEVRMGTAVRRCALRKQTRD